MTKAAAEKRASSSSSMDNQPGPHPGEPAPPDSHRTRAVAAGALTLAAGALGAKKLYNMGGTLAKQTARVTQNPAARAQMAQHLTSLRSQVRAGGANAAAAGADLASARKQLAPSLRDRGQALMDAAKSKVNEFRARGVAKDLAAPGPHNTHLDPTAGVASTVGHKGVDTHTVQSASDASHAKLQTSVPDHVDEALLNKVHADSPHLRAQLEKQHPDHKFATPPDVKKRYVQVAKGAVIGAGVIGAGSVIGGSAASRAAQPQDNSQPGA